MTTFYSPSNRGFYVDAIHGSRSITVIDPAYVRPTKLVPDFAWDSPGAPEEDRPFISVEDDDAIPDCIIVPNPDCAIPLDAVEITEELHAYLMDQQAQGKVIRPGPDGMPIAADQPPPSEDEIRCQRDTRIAATDWTQLGDIPAATKAAWKTYRQALRDVTAQPGFPADVAWPTAPA